MSAELLYALLPPEGGHAVWIRQLAPLGDTRVGGLEGAHLLTNSVVILHHWKVGHPGGRPLPCCVGLLLTSSHMLSSDVRLVAPLSIWHSVTNAG